MVPIMGGGAQRSGRNSIVEQLKKHWQVSKDQEKQMFIESVDKYSMIRKIKRVIKRKWSTHHLRCALCLLGVYYIYQKVYLFVQN